MKIFIECQSLGYVIYAKNLLWFNHTFGIGGEALIRVKQMQLLRFPLFNRAPHISTTWN